MYDSYWGYSDSEIINKASDSDDDLVKSLCSRLEACIEERLKLEIDIENLKAVLDSIEELVS